MIQPHMITLRKAQDRGHAQHGWLDSWHSFSFASYHDPRHMGVGNLRVINEDRIAPGTGFGTHGHRDMEIVSYVLDGALAHKDSMGNGDAGSAVGDAASDGASEAKDAKHSGVIQPGDVQRMSAGTGVMHSEFNHSAEQTTHFLQIWLLPQYPGLEPSYEQKHFDAAAKRGRLVLVAAPDGRDGAVTIHADASIRAGLFDGEEHAELTLDPSRITYLHVVRGALQVNGHALQAGDAARLDAEALLLIDQGRSAEVLVFDLAP